MKRFFSWLLVLCMVLTLLSGSVFAADVVDSGTCGENVTWTLDSTGLMTVSGTGAVTASPQLAGYMNDVTALVIEPGVTSLGDGAFDYFSFITSVTIPDTVTNIGAHAFAGCIGLTSVMIPDSVTSIGEDAFTRCSGLKEIQVANSNPSFASADGVLFNKDKSVLLVYPVGKEGAYAIPDGVTRIESRAFYDCENLSGVTMTDSVESIGDFAFSCCSSLTDVTMPDHVTYLGEEAFSGCGSLKSMMIPRNVASIGARAFVGCSELPEIRVADQNPSYASIDGVLFNKDKSVLLAYPAGRQGEYAIPDGVTGIGDNAFSSCSALTHVVFPRGVTTVGDFAFEYCSGLTSMELPEGLTSIGRGAFAICESLKSISIPRSVRTIGDSAFYFCLRLETITIPEGVTSIGPSTFYYCGISSVRLPKTLETISARAFIAFVPEDVYYCGTEAQWNAIKITETEMLEGVESIDDVFGDAKKHFEAHDDKTVKNAKDAACTEAGYTGDEVCAFCGETIHQGSSIPAKGHSFGDWIVTTPATVDAEGTETHTCSVCGETETRPIDKLTPPAPANPFEDVIAGKYYYNAVLWAVNHDPQITKGTDATHFKPNAPCTRGEVVTFLWRAMGCPDPTRTDCPFTDVGAKKFYYKAVLWAVENGITTGTSATTFGPNEPCTRGHVVTFLYRAKKAQPVSIENKFTDLNPKGFYYKAVLWAVANDVTQGTSKTTFEPGKTCTRGQIVTFLQRADKV